MSVAVMRIEFPGWAARMRRRYQQTPENGILETSDAVINGERIMVGEFAG
jgi:hypothetical protein